MAIQRNVLTINGTAVANPALGGVQIVDNSMWAEGAGRSTSGKWIGDLKGWKTQITIKWPPLPLSEVKRIRDAIQAGGAFFNITYKEFSDAGSNTSGVQTITKRVYCPDSIPREIYSLNEKAQLEAGLQVVFTEA